MSAQKTDSGTNSLTEPNDLKVPYAEALVEAEPGVGRNGDTAWVVDHHAERALCRKFDYRLLPVLAVMYLFNALDKGNLGNAKTDGMEKDLNFKSNQYNIILSVFYVPYGNQPISLSHIPQAPYFPGQEEVSVSPARSRLSLSQKKYVANSLQFWVLHLL